MRWLTLLIFLFLCIGIAFYLGLIRLSDIAADHFSRKLQVAVSIDSLKPGFKEIKIEEIQIGNPRGYSLPKAFAAKEAHLHAPCIEYFKENVVIEEIDINDIYLGIEFDSPTSIKGNWTVLMENFIQSTQSDVKKNPQRTILIKRLVLTNINTQLLFHGKGSAQNLPKIDRMEFTNITHTGGIPMDQLIESILGQMLQSIFINNHLDNMLDSIMKKPSKAAKKAITPFKKLFK